MAGNICRVMCVCVLHCFHDLTTFARVLELVLGTLTRCGLTGLTSDGRNRTTNGNLSSRDRVQRGRLGGFAHDITHEGTTADTSDILSLKTILTIGHRELHIFARCQSMITAVEWFDSAMMDKEILTLIVTTYKGDEPITKLWVEPLDLTHAIPKRFCIFLLF